MKDFAATADAIAGTRSKLKKVERLAAYFAGLDDPDLRAAAVFLSGRPFPLHDARTLNAGWSVLGNAVQQMSRASDDEIHAAYLDRGDLGEVAERLLQNQSGSQLTPSQVAQRLEELASVSTPARKLALVSDLLEKLAPLEAKYVIKVITGELRIGLKENTVEEAIAAAFTKPPEAVRRANMLLGDIGETAILARYGRLDEATLKLFRPLKFMLATPVESEADIYSNFSGPFYVEDKYDGIRGQLHIHNRSAALFSRTLDDVSHQFPEIVLDAAQLNGSWIFDGEVVAFGIDGILPFALLQKRLGRKRPSAALLAEIPTALMIFDVLYAGDRALLDFPLQDRKRTLEGIAWPAPLHPAPFTFVGERVALEPFFDQSQIRRNEGLMLKGADSAYAPGKRGMSWLKWKKALATLDVVVTGVEFGHGRRRDVLSDYTFAVRKGEKLLNIGKAYSGLTDNEINEMTEFFKQHTIQDFGRFRVVEPSVVLEVAFNGIQKSGRHASGYALRFPRIVRIRTDKSVSEIDTIESVERIIGHRN